MPALRPSIPADLPALYAIALATGHHGEDASALHKNPRLVGHIYAAPYAVLEPGLALVAEDEEGVAGYVVGALDTAAWEERLERDWWPGLREEVADPSGTPHAAWTADQMRSWLIHHPYRVPSAVVTDFPAHLHMNLLPRLQGRGTGTALLNAWFDRARSLGAKAAHVGVSRANLRGLGFWSARGFEELKGEAPTSSRTAWMGRRI